MANAQGIGSHLVTGTLKVCKGRTHGSYGRPLDKGWYICGDLRHLKDNFKVATTAGNKQMGFDPNAITVGLKTRMD